MNQILQAIQLAMSRHIDASLVDRIPDDGSVMGYIDRADVLTRIGGLTPTGATYGISDADIIAAAVLWIAVERKHLSIEHDIRPVYSDGAIQLLTELCQQTFTVDGFKYTTQISNGLATKSPAVKTIIVANLIVQTNDIISQRNTYGLVGDERKKYFTFARLMVNHGCAGANAALIAHFNQLVGVS